MEQEHIGLNKGYNKNKAAADNEDIEELKEDKPTPKHAKQNETDVHDITEFIDEKMTCGKFVR